ncbi:MAG: PH domain-containing protein [Candidatus Micrarchaeaceae archaeon]
MNTNFTDREKEILSKVMEADEEIIAVGRQNRLSKLIAPSIALSTSKKIIIFKRDALGIRTDMHFIPYESIVSFRVVHGFIFSSIKLRLLGAVKPGEHAMADASEDETEIRGLKKSMAKFLAVKISENVSKSRSKTREPREIIIKHSTPAVNIFFNTNITSFHSPVPGMYLPNDSAFNAYAARILSESQQTEKETEKQAEKEAMFVSGTAETNGVQEATTEATYVLESDNRNSDLASAKKEIEINELMRHAESTQTNTQIPEGSETASAIKPDDLLIFKNRKYGTKNENARSHYLNSIGFIKSLFLGRSQDADADAASANAYFKDDFIDEITRKKLSED